jgi:hypothetical protein
VQGRARRRRLSGGGGGAIEKEREEIESEKIFIGRPRGYT